MCYIKIQWSAARFKQSYWALSSLPQDDGKEVQLVCPRRRLKEKDWHGSHLPCLIGALSLRCVCF
ncbi:hypothetical protein PVAP13_8KG216515 [Panicum virgatum]|uniref:Uncharacterized protein n=1 Tax=Panicum virgatum TaxID=38727 RepID=A0A8T0PIW4_PANVG|nr:hypothetical protein PVAP13_8KG216515 [Panicum virgatum]